MAPFKDLTGKKFGRLTAIKRIGESWYWLCRCDCGNETRAATGSLNYGNTQSCGCLQRDKTTTHGASYTRLYHTWKSLLARIRGTSGKKSQQIYRGKTCDWKSFEEFRQDMEPGYLKHSKEYGEANTTIDRIDGTKGYSKENCRWATYQVQGFNTTRTVRITWQGETRSMRQWAKHFGIGHNVLKGLLDRGVKMEDVKKEWVLISRPRHN